jgi:hypothetical protein
MPSTPNFAWTWLTVNRATDRSMPPSRMTMVMPVATRSSPPDPFFAGLGAVILLIC